MHALGLLEHQPTKRDRRVDLVVVSVDSCEGLVERLPTVLRFVCLTPDKNQSASSTGFDFNPLAPLYRSQVNSIEFFRRFVPDI